MAPGGSFSRAEAFERNRGLVSIPEQEKLANSLVVIAGCGGVGGLHAHTLARLGIGRFRITDPDGFSVANFNRQIGATVDTVGRNKAEVTANMIHSINPDASVEIMSEPVSSHNANRFIKDSNLIVDGLDFFALDARRELFSVARTSEIPVITAAPLGFSATLHVFAKGGMSFDAYFDLRDDQDRFDQLVSFFVGLAPKGLHLPYMDLSTVNIATGRGPSSIVGCQLAACLIGTEAVRILTGKGPSRLAPDYLQFDTYRQMIAKGRLSYGNRNWMQRLKRRIVKNRLQSLGLDRVLASAKPDVSKA